MSIRSLYGMPERRGMDKRATVAEILQAMAGYFNWAHAKMLAAAMLAGGAGGYALSKMTAKGQNDINTAKKSYQNERAMADIGYLKTQLSDEYADSKRDKEPERAMRMV